jgi:hypothetical protein
METTFRYVLMISYGDALFDMACHSISFRHGICPFGSCSGSSWYLWDAVFCAFLKFWDDMPFHILLALYILDGSSALFYVVLLLLSFYFFGWSICYWIHIVLCWVFLNVFPLMIDAVNRRVCWIATSPIYCIRKGKPQRTKKISAFDFPLPWL